MAITKAISGNPVRGYYIETIQTGRIIRQTGGTGISGFGQPRLGGLTNAIVDGLPGGGTGAGRMQTPAVASVSERVAQLHTELAKEAEKARVDQHKDYIDERREVAKVTRDEAKKADEIQKKIAEEAKKADEKSPVDPNQKVEIVKDPGTGERRVTAGDNAPASALDDPKKIAAAETKTAEQQKKETAPANPDKK
jgi:hypothetical protein